MRTGTVQAEARQAAPKVIRRKVAYPMIEFVRPGCFWPTPFSVEQAFGLMRDVVRRGMEEGTETRERWGTWKVTDLVGGGSGYGLGTVRFRSVDALRQGFQHLLLARTRKNLEDWRDRVGLTPAGTYEATFPHYKPMAGTPLGGESHASEATVRRATEALLGGYRGRELAACLNPTHLAARTVGDVAVVMGRTRLWFELEYLLDGSHWFETLATARPDESFSGTLARATARMRLLAGEETTDPAELCLRLNEASRSDPEAYPREDWILGTRPIRTTCHETQEPQPALVVAAKVGYGNGCARIAAMPSGRVMLEDPTFDYERLRATVDLMLPRLTPEATPTPDAVRRVHDDETTAVRPLYDRHSRWRLRAKTGEAIPDAELDAMPVPQPIEVDAGLDF